MRKYFNDFWPNSKTWSQVYYIEGTLPLIDESYLPKEEVFQDHLHKGIMIRMESSEKFLQEKLKDIDHYLFEQYYNAFSVDFTAYRSDSLELTDFMICSLQENIDSLLTLKLAEKTGVGVFKPPMFFQKRYDKILSGEKLISFKDITLILSYFDFLRKNIEDIEASYDDNIANLAKFIEDISLEPTDIEAVETLKKLAQAIPNNNNYSPENLLSKISFKL